MVDVRDQAAVHGGFLSDVRAESSCDGHLLKLVQGYAHGVHESFLPGLDGSFGQLDLADVLLGDPYVISFRILKKRQIAALVIFSDQIDDGLAHAFLCQPFRGQQLTGLVHNACPHHLAYGVYDAGSADADGLAVADHLDGNALVRQVDPLDGACGSSHALGYGTTLKGRACSRGAGGYLALAAHHDLAVGADIDEEMPLVLFQDVGGDESRSYVGAHVARDIWYQSYLSAFGALHAKIFNGPCHGPLKLRLEWRYGQAPGIDPQEKMGHGGVSNDHVFFDVA